MSRGIFLINEKNEPVEMREERYDSEARLQQLLADHPAILSGDQIDPTNPRRWLFITKELSLASEEDGAGRWFVDHLFIDQDAIPTIIEVKRSTDSRIRREVVGQMLDYAANAVVYLPVQTIRERFEAQCEKRGKNPDEELNAALGIGDSAETYWQNVKTNLQAGRVRLVFVADEIPSELRRIVEFLNEQMDPAEVLAVEIKQYVAGNLRTLVPSVIGQTQEAQQRKSIGGTSTKQSRQWNEENFFEDMRARLSDQDVQLAKYLFQWVQDNATTVKWGIGKEHGSFAAMLNHGGKTYPLFYCYTSGYVEIPLYRLRDKPVFNEEPSQMLLLERLQAVSGVTINERGFAGTQIVQFTTLVEGSARSELLAVMDWLKKEIEKVAQ